MRASSPSKACAECGSQKTSMLSASAVGPSATTASSIGPVDEVDVCRPLRRVLAGHDVRAEEGRVRGELAGDAQAAQLVVEGQAVAALDLDRRRALGPHLGDAGRHEGAQLVVARGAGRGDRDGDAATVVGRARHPGGELGRPVTGEDEVGVRVDETGDDGAAAEVATRVGVGRLGRAVRPTRPAPSSETTSAASRTMPRRASPGSAWSSPRAGSFVVSSAMPVRSRLTRGTPSGDAVDGADEHAGRRRPSGGGRR